MDKLEFRKNLENRTKRFSVSVIHFLKSFKFNVLDIEISKQILRSVTSVGANYREANRAETKKDFIHKIGIVEKEISESSYWFEIVEETWQMSSDQVEHLTFVKKECHELLLLFSSISRSIKE